MKTICILSIGYLTMALTGCQIKRQQHEQAIKIDTLKPVEKTYIMNSAEIRKHDALQEHIEASEDNSYTIYDYTVHDVEIALPVIAEGLKRKNFITLDNDAFNEKLKTIFGDIFGKENKKVKLRDKFNTVFVDSVTNEYNEFDYTIDNIFISKEYNFITYVPLIGDFVHFVDSNHYTIEINPPLIARNKYLLNNSQPDLAFLLHEDVLFLKTLVKSFGYTKEPRINDLVMKDYLDLDNDRRGIVGEIIFVKNAAGVLEIKEELLQWITDHTSINDNRMADALGSYAIALYDESYNTFLKVNAYHFSRDEKRKIAAYIANTYDPLYRRFVVQNQRIWPAEGVLNGFLLDDDGMAEYFKQHNYFSLPALKMEMELLNNSITVDASQ